MTTIDMEKLIEEVRERRFFYDKEDKFYRDTTRKDNAWNEVGKTLGISGEDAKQRWGKVKKQYTQYLCKLNNPSGSGRTPTPQFRYAGVMEFYRACYRPYSSISNVDEENNEEEMEDSAVDSESAPNTPGSVIEIEYNGFESHNRPEVVVDYQKATSMPSIQKNRGNKRKRENVSLSDKIAAALEETSKQEDEFDFFGALIGGKLRNLSQSNRRISIEAQQEVLQVLTKYELQVLDTEGTLNSN